VRKRGGPLGLHELRFHIVGREHHDCSIGLPGGVLHLKHEIATGPEIPSLKDDRIALFLKDEADLSSFALIAP
jgi:hypothetical protein